MILVICEILFALMVLGTAFVIIVDKGDSGRKLAWLMVITFLPGLGLFLYVCFGINFRHHWIFNRRHKRYRDAFLAGTDDRLNRQLFHSPGEDRLPDKYRPLSRLLASGSRLQASQVDELEIITKGSWKFCRLMEDLREAKESIHMEYFHFGNDAGSRAIKEVLMQKAREGVEVRFINENIANFPISSLYYDDMKKAGVEVQKFTNPRSHLVNMVTLLNYRDHRKIVVIDGRIGYTGGMNINDKYFLRWRDTHLRLTGDAVASLQYLFLDSWLSAGGTLSRPLRAYFPSETESCGPLVQIVPDSPQEENPVLQMGYEWVLHHAKDYIWLQTPYFVPPEPVLDALKAAALSGTDVRLMLPATSDNFFMRPANRLYFKELVESGVKIYLRKGEFMHCKTFVCDDDLCSVGTANLDYRSFSINYEVNTYIFDRETALRCKEIFLKDQEQSDLVTIETVDSGRWHHRIGEGLIGLFAPLL